jgi:hypothetical protein
MFTAYRFLFILLKPQRDGLTAMTSIAKTINIVIAIIFKENIAIAIIFATSIFIAIAIDLSSIANNPANNAQLVQNFQ